MTSQTTREGSRFIVDFGAIEVPTVLAAELEGEIQRLALSVLSRIDFRGDLHIRRLPTGTWGYIFDPGGYPPPPPEDGGSTPVTIYDHTAIMQLLLQRPLPVLREIAVAQKSAGDKTPKPPWYDILQAIIKLLGPPASTQRAIQATIQTGRVLDAQKMPRQTQLALDRINKQVDAAKDLDDLVETLRAAQRSDDGTVQGLATGLGIAEQMIEAGRGSIYDPSFGVYGDMGDPTVAYSVAKDDVKGAASGAVAGALTGSLAGGVGAGPGAATGACVGGIGASVGSAVGKLLDWLF